MLVISVLIVQFLCGQGNNQTDSLLGVLRITQDDKARARLFLKISKEEELRAPEKSLSYAKQARQIAQRSDFDSAELRAMIIIGVNFNRMNNLKESIEIGEQIVEKASRNNMQLEIADGRAIMAVAYAQGGDYDNSSKLYFENLKLYEKLNEKKWLGVTLGNIGINFIKQQSFEKALDYVNKALSIGLEINNMTIVANQYNNLAEICNSGFHDFSKALQYFFKSLEIAKKNNDFHLQGINLLNIGVIYMDLNKFDTAFNCFNQSLNIYQNLKNPVYTAYCQIEIGKYYFKKGDFLEGKEITSDALKIGEESGNLQIKFDASELLHKFCLSEKDTIAAYKYHVVSTNAQDSLYSLQSRKELYKLEFKYNQDKILKEQRIRQLKYFFLFGFIILGLLSGLAMIVLINSRQKIKIKNTVLEKEKAESDLTFKNKELSINLLALLKKNELITEISRKFTELENASSMEEMKETSAKINHDIKQRSDDRLWQELSVQFKKANSEFYEKLLKQYPDLSQNELKLCAYLRLNMSTKEIAGLTGQSAETLIKARYRLRKKFGLTNSESHLGMFLNQI
jgi:tetratricopeptide (TPR) repeat protein